MSLLTDLRDAETRPGCPLCAFIRAQDEVTRDALRVASAQGGTIGINRLTEILQKHKTGIGKRTVSRHRNEGHQP